jgi:putative phosphoesterase
MRIGIVSDLHGNTAGLLRAIELMGDVDEVLCAGDMVTEYKFSNPVLEELRAREIRGVLGNHDIGLLGPHGDRVRANPEVNPDLVSYLGTHPNSIEVDVGGGKKLLMTHASPCTPHHQYVFKGSAELKRFAEVEADFIIIGHTHAQMVERVGRALVINPGSAGQATDPGNGRQLSCAVLDTATDEVVIHDYDVER